jgi:hypothetical protein
VCVAPLQIGVVPEQSALAVQRTHVPDPVSHTGVEPVHSTALPAEHWPHAPPGWQAGVDPPHSPSPPHARHVRNDGSQMGVEPPQSALARQPTHDLVEVLHTGVGPEHCVLFKHCTQLAVDVSQTGVAPPHRPMLVAEQALHAPDVWHAGALAGHCASVVQGPQVCVPMLQIGVVPEQFASATQATQTRGDTLVRHCDVEPLQSPDTAHCSTNTSVVCAPEVPLLPSVR